VENSFCSKTAPSFSAAISTSKPFPNNAAIIGIQRVACPKPQSSGAISTFLLGVELLMEIEIYSK
jgi:hypothetical protein